VSRPAGTVNRSGKSRVLRAAAAGLLLAAAGAAMAPSAAGDAIYYRRDADGNLVITNVPDRRDLRVLTPERRQVRPGSGAQYRDLIDRAAREHGLHPDLVYAVAAVESSFDPLARSVKGAQGLMQLMPETADRFGVRDAWNPEDNVRGGARFLRYLLDLFEGNLRLALAAYNAGENVVLTQGRIPPYAETRTYVAKIMKRFGDGRDPYLPASSEADTPAETVAEQPSH
jgi:soluble lytic murein transglycosylase-like protein